MESLIRGTQNMIIITHLKNSNNKKLDKYDEERVAGIIRHFLKDKMGYTSKTKVV